MKLSSGNKEISRLQQFFCLLFCFKILNIPKRGEIAVELISEFILMLLYALLHVSLSYFFSLTILLP